MAGRPLVCSRRGFSGSEVWFWVATRVLRADDFGRRYHSCLRAHDGVGSDPRRAGGFLDRAPDRGEWGRTLLILLGMPLHVRVADGWRAVSPHLVTGDGGSVPNVTPHALKRAKPSAYVALRLHVDYTVEAGGHAGSRIERMSVSGMRQDVRGIRPSGTATALRYARGCSLSTPAAVDHLVADVVRSFVASEGLLGLARPGAWDRLHAWALHRVGEVPGALFASGE